MELDLLLTAGPMGEITDRGLRALADAGCGKLLALLVLHGDAYLLYVSRAVVGENQTVVVLLWCLHADLKEGVSDEGLIALAEVGCGRDLVMLSLASEFAFEFC